MKEKGVRRDVERNAEEHVARALVHEKREFPVRYEELEEHMARWKSHLIELARVPGGYDKSPTVWVLLNHFDHVRNLVHGGTVWLQPLSPLHAVYATKVAREGGLRRPVVSGSVRGPDGLLGTVQLLEAVVVARALENPQELALNSLEGEFLGGDGREAVAHLESHLKAK